jgi:hypothetical protein
MSSSAIIQSVSREQWLKLAPTFRDYNYRQIWEYGIALAARRGAACEHVAIRQADDLIALADVRIKRMPLVGGGIAYISGGPLTRKDDQHDPERLGAVLDALVGHYCRDRGFILRILAPLGPLAWNEKAEQVFAGLGFVPTTRSARYQTMVIDISPPPADVRKKLEQKWRNCLNASERKGLTLRHGTDDTLFAEFCRLFSAFHDRKGFAVDLDANFYRELQRSLSEPDRLLVALADLEGKIAGGHVMSILGDTAVYLLGATSAEGLNNKAAYLLQWHAIARARERGAKFYDLGGIDPAGNPGVYHFKAGMGGQTLASPGPYEYRAASWRTRIAVGAESVYQRVKRPGKPSRARAAS